ncbi:MAG TPA: peptide deformylase [Anaerovoracaceae bacterium]|nr:peptide deformylase [Anaerovoracaceae bacterium]
MIITDEKILRTPCIDVLPDEVGALREALEKELKLSEEGGRPGIGLAAPQIGIFKKMAIVRIPNKEGVCVFGADLINCRIAAGYDSAFFDNEGCLSYPDKFVRTMRYQEIYVVENLIEPFSFIATGLAAVCIQHELDHLRGVLLPDVALK